MNKWVLRAAFAALSVLILAAAYVLSVFGPVYEVARGQSIRHDDFFYTVTAVARRPRDSRHDRYVVTVVVENRSMRVGYSWRDRIAYVRDGRGPRYAPVSQGTFTLAPGVRRTVALEFDLPNTMRHPLLRFWDGVYLGDVFNAVRYAKAGVPLAGSAHQN